ncbi:MAG: glycosyltransferase family 2 protein [Stomatobaculum sp.]|nr:glycosyltransferase family 2 protein [Stomatobaculum sp.]
MNEVLVIIPAYNEEANISRVVDDLIRNYPELDYVVVNDGSGDRTAEICRENGYCFLDLPVNLGLAGAFQAGMKYADRKGYRYAVQFDGDGQHRAEFIAPMREKMEEGYNIVIASRFVTEKKPHSLRMLGSRIISAAIRLSSGAALSDPTSGMRMYDRRMIHLFANQINYPPEPDTVCWLVKNGAKVAEVQAVMDERTAGVSYLTPMNAVRYMTRTLISILFIQSFRVKEKLKGGTP